MPKIISECCELVKLCDINCSGPVFWRHTVVFPQQTLWQYSDGISLTGASNAWGVKNRKFQPSISLYLKNDTKYCSYYGTLIELVWRYAVYQMVVFSMTLSDHLPIFQGHAIISRWISQTVRDTDISWNAILIVTYTFYSTTQNCHVEWPWAT